MSLTDDLRNFLDRHAHEIESLAVDAGKAAAVDPALAAIIPVFSTLTADAKNVVSAVVASLQASGQPGTAPSLPAATAPPAGGSPGAVPPAVTTPAVPGAPGALPAGAGNASAGTPPAAAAVTPPAAPGTTAGQTDPTGAFIWTGTQWLQLAAPAAATTPAVAPAPAAAAPPPAS